MHKILFWSSVYVDIFAPLLKVGNYTLKQQKGVSVYLLIQWWFLIQI
jgi:hypothetical protein